MKRLIAALLLVCAAVLWAALPASDNFNRADGSLGANWTQSTGGVGSFEISTNAARLGTSSGYNSISWSADAFATNHYSQVRVASTSATTRYIGPAVRVQTGALTWYAVVWDGTTAGMEKVVAGVYTDLAQGFAVAVNDVVRMEAEGTTIRAINVTQGITRTITDASITGGAAGLAAWSGPTNTVDDWQGGNLASTRRRNAVIAGVPHLTALLLHGHD